MNHRTMTMSRQVGITILTLIGFAACQPALSQETADYFKRNCANCHTIGGGRLTGPDLKDVGSRKDSAWLTKFMLNPKVIIDSGDTYARQMLDEYRGVVMPATADLTAERCESILKFIESESKLERSQFAGSSTKIPDRPFTIEEVEKGHAMFVGTIRFAKQGAPCLSCHSVQGVATAGGGMLGPDLTLVFNKLQGRKGLAAWLSAPATPTMQPIYKERPLTDDEILHLIAYLESTKDGRVEPGSARFNFFLLGLAGTAGALVLFDVIWGRRLRSVRRALVNGATDKEIA